MGHGGVESALWAMWGTKSGEEVLESKRKVEVRRHIPSVARARYVTIVTYAFAWGKRDDPQEVGWERHMEERSRQLAAKKPKTKWWLSTCHSAHDAHYRPRPRPHAYKFSFVYVVVTHHTLNWERTMCPASRDARGGRD